MDTARLPPVGENPDPLSHSASPLNTSSQDRAPSPSPLSRLQLSAQRRSFLTGTNNNNPSNIPRSAGKQQQQQRGGISGPRSVADRSVVAAAQALAGRLYTVGGRREGPVFVVGQVGRRRVSDGSEEKQLPSNVSRAVLEPLDKSGTEDIVMRDIPNYTARPILKAKKPLVIPKSSTRSASARKALETANNRLPGVDVLARPIKRPGDEQREVEDIIGTVVSNRLSQTILPPIQGGAAEAVAGAAAGTSTTGVAPAKRVRVREPTGSDQAGDTDMSDADRTPSVTAREAGGSVSTRPALPATAVAAAAAGPVSDTPYPIHRQGRDPFAFIAYLQQHPGTNEFAYMNPVKGNIKSGQPTFNPYNLEIVEFGEIDRESGEGYYTISAAGVTHYNPAGHGTFTPLPQWLREHTLFHSLLRIPFFHRYRIWKCFTLWRRTVLASKIAHSRLRLSRNLFIIHPVLRDALVAVREACVRVAVEGRLVNVKEGKSYELEEFVREQKEWVADVAERRLKEWEDGVRKVVEEAGVACLKSKGFDVEWDAGGGKEGDEKDGGAAAADRKESVPPPTTMDRPTSGKKTVQSTGNLKEAPTTTGGGPRKLTFTEQAARRTESRRLQRFVKLADYMIVNTLHMLMIESAKDLLGFVFRGCVDEDVVIDASGNGGIVVGEGAEGIAAQLMLLMAGGEDGEAGSGGPAGLNRTASGTGGDTFGAGGNAGGGNNNNAQGLGGIQVGGVVVGEEVSTTELVKCGFDGFPAVLSRIIKAAVPKLELVEVVEEEGPHGAGGTAMDIDTPSSSSLDTGPTPTTTTTKP
ncbi:Dynein heavy chain 6, axonemal, partial [Borealophlyctis nickersoniae]